MVSLEQNNRGFSLVELLVSISILSVVGLAIGGFLYVSMNQYRAANAEVNIQAEAQLVQSQLTNLILGTSQGMDAAEDVLTLFCYDTEAKEKSCIRICFAETDHRLLYTRCVLEEDGAGGGSWRAEAEKQDLFFAQYVKAFSAELLDETGAALTGENEIRQVKLCIDYEQNGREYQSDFVVTPRNQVIASDDVSVLYESVE